MSSELFVTQILNGLVSGSMYALIGAGVALIYGTQRILNFAQGEFFMLAAFGLFVFSTQLGLPLVVAAVLAVILVTAFSALVYRAAIQPLMNCEGWEFSTIAVTLGISVLLQNIAFLLWGEKYQTVPYYLDGSIGLAGITMPLQRVLVFLTCVSVIVAMTLFLKYSRTGWAIRATAQQPDAAAVVGVPVQRIRMLTFAIGCGLAAIAAVVLAPIFAVNPWIGVPHLLKGFVVVIMGGIGSFPGAILAGFVLGIVEAIGITLTSSEWRDVIAFATVILVIWLRPSGLLGKS